MNTVLYNVKEEELSQIIKDPQLLRDHMSDYNDLSLDTLWQGVIFFVFKKDLRSCLNDEILPLYGLLGHNNLKIDPDLGFIDMSYSHSNEVKLAYNYLKQLDIEKLKNQVTLQELKSNNVYPTDLWENESVINSLKNNLNWLINFYKSASEKSESVIVVTF
ncbi:DUF1877 family protein [Flammeovirga aprica]|uniref:DUF1877 family protein n=1 Tax=Flammeovirga aprica JL-4 TaxID=694437 RepID=A0A7X9RY58_9BACT|nr:DUF1877 family protein [Flammeovirga aprica]NME70938.1 DUF1877 family protein [Flammeovirga aprica JL-4]